MCCCFEETITDHAKVLVLHPCFLNRTRLTGIFFYRIMQFYFQLLKRTKLMIQLYFFNFRSTLGSVLTNKTVLFLLEDLLY